MNVINHNGAPFGEIKSEYNFNKMYYTFHPKKDWDVGYSAYQLENIAKQMRRLGKK